MFPPDQENHLRLKNFFISEYLWNLSFTIHVLLKFLPLWEEALFSSQRYTSLGK